MAEGDNVWFSTNFLISTRLSKKPDAKFVGPFRVLEQMNAGVAFSLQLPPSLMDPPSFSSIITGQRSPFYPFMLTEPTRHETIPLALPKINGASHAKTEFIWTSGPFRSKLQISSIKRKDAEQRFWEGFLASAGFTRRFCHSRAGEEGVALESALAEVRTGGRTILVVPVLITWTEKGDFCRDSLRVLAEHFHGSSLLCRWTWRSHRWMTSLAKMGLWFSRLL